MQEGTIEAVSSVFSGNYATPQDKWEAAGYAIGVPLAIGAQLITAEASLGAEAIEGLYQESQRAFANVASKLEKWGFFAKNAVKSTADSPNVLQEILKKAKLTSGKANQLEVVLDDGSKVIFRRDIGEHAHSIGKDYPNPTDHYNIEIHTANPTRPGKFTPQENVHIVVDDKLQLVGAFLKNKVRIIFDSERNNFDI